MPAPAPFGPAWSATLRKGSDAELRSWVDLAMAACDEADAIDALFLEDGHWRPPPSDWGNPDKVLENKAFMAVFEQCVKNLPAKTGRAFMMREVMELSTDDICKELGVSTTNCWVILHRARLSLRECLEMKWFGKS